MIFREWNNKRIREERDIFNIRDRHNQRHVKNSFTSYHDITEGQTDTKNIKIILLYGVLELVH